ncbi:MAG: hypothetical protein M1504_01145, partial [Candidatus Marsarchaeota archaeon]|nr:hypothetical protein [Candidatus Marsarchaeota archaeon]
SVRASLLAALKNDKTIDNEMYKGFYRLVKGGVFPSKASLLMHITGKGVKISEERHKQLKHI